MWSRISTKICSNSEWHYAVITDTITYLLNPVLVYLVLSRPVYFIESWMIGQWKSDGDQMCSVCCVVLSSRLKLCSPIVNDSDDRRVWSAIYWLIVITWQFLKHRNMSCKSLQWCRTAYASQIKLSWWEKVELVIAYNRFCNETLITYMRLTLNISHVAAYSFTVWFIGNIPYFKIVKVILLKVVLVFFE